MRPTQILLDMDGVLADFFAPALDKMNAANLGRRFTDADYISHNEPDMAKVFGVAASVFWRTIESDYFWEDLKLFPHTPMLVSRLRQTDIPIVVASSPSFNPRCVPAKVKWLRNNLGFMLPDCMFGSAKHLMARPGTLLIDDMPKNCDKFIANGGQAVCVPSNWNTLSLNLDTVWDKIEPHLS